MADLFDDIPDRAMTPSERRRLTTRPNGYYAPPGSGPKGETCRTCRFAVRIRSGRRGWYKCEKARNAWTRGRGTDILLQTPACRGWEADGDE